MELFDVVIVGLGGMGSSAAYACSKSGAKILGLEQFQRGHTFGSSHGQTRLIRKAYFEHPNYVPLLERSYQLWAQLERETGTKLFHQTGLIIFGAKNSKVLEGVRLASRQYGVPTTEYSAAECPQKFLQFQIPEGLLGIEEKTGGFLEVEKCVEAFLSASESRGARLRFGEGMTAWKKVGNQIRVITSQGEYQTKRLILTAGPWAPQWLKVKLKVNRAPQFWFNAPARYDEASGLPCFAFDLPTGFFYGFPSYNEHGFKVALHKPGFEVADPSLVDRVVTAEEAVEIQKFLRQVLPEVDPRTKESTLCLYTMTPDSHFVVDQLPGFPEVAFAAGFSGHGFKFASVIGEALKEMSGIGSCEPNLQKLMEFLRVRRDA